MIHFVTTRENAHTIEGYLAWYGRPARPLLQPVTYEELFAWPAPRPGVYCFTDIELLSPEARARAASCHTWLVERGWAVLNDPLRTPGRYDLQQLLRHQGINRFAVHRWPVDPHAVRFPAFVRREQDHLGRRSELVHTTAELTDAVARLAETGIDPADALVVEFCDTADTSGRYRKYGAFVVGRTIVPRHVQVSDHWHIKDATIRDAAALEEEHRYLAANPHAAHLAEICAMASVSYGRIDYALLGDEIQVWEINTNPTIAHPPPSAERALKRRRRGLSNAAPRPRRHRGLRPMMVDAAHRATDAIPPLARLERARWERRPRAAAHASFVARLLPLWEELDRDSGRAASG